MKNWDVENIRADFPTLELNAHGKKLVYLDNGATTQKPKQVIDVIKNYYDENNANVHRGLHYLAERATAGYEACRTTIAQFINAQKETEIVLTKGTTESINLVAHSWGRKFISAGDEIILTEMEHHSNIVPWHILAQEKGVKIHFLPFSQKGELDIEDFKKLLNKNTKLLSMAHISNAIGTINPIKKYIDIAHAHGVKVLIDGAQSAPALPIDVQALDADFYAFSAHKMLGPTGMGALFIKEDIAQEMNPFFGGGEMIKTVSKEGATFADPPHRFEAGTPNIAGAFGFKAAIDYLTAFGMENIALYKKRLTDYAMDNISRVPGLTIIGNAEKHSSAISFTMENIHPFDLAPFLDQNGIAIRAGHHCAQPLMQAYGIKGTARASFYIYNTFQEIDFLVEKLKMARSFF